jgi:hypothetical protein
MDLVVQVLYLIIQMQHVPVVVVVLLRSNASEVGGLHKSFKYILFEAFFLSVQLQDDISNFK